jgi:hypothetical protein
MTSRVPKEVITTRTMRDTLLRTGITVVIEEYNKMVISQKDLIDRVIPIKGITRRGDIMAIRNEETTTRTSGVPTAIKIGDAIAAKREGAMATRTRDATTTRIEGGMATSKIGVATVETNEALTATRKEDRMAISREDRTGTNRGERMAHPTGVLTMIEATMAIGKQALTRVAPPRGNAAQEWESEPNPARGAKVEGITGAGAINLSTRAADRNRVALGRS